jgi:hypothetical protein
MSGRCGAASRWNGDSKGSAAYSTMISMIGEVSIRRCIDSKWAVEGVTANDFCTGMY